MNSEKLADCEPIPSVNVSSDKKANAVNILFWLQAIVFFAGIGLFIYLIYETGLKTLSDALGRVGYGFLLIVFLNGTRHVFRALSIYLAVPSPHRTFKFRRALAARLGGEAVSVVTFTGPFLGDATKAALLKSSIPISQGGAAVVLDNIPYYTSVIILILSGIIVMLAGYNSSAAMRDALIITAVLVSFFLIAMGLIIRFRIKPASWTIRRLSARNLAPGFIENKKEGVYKLEDNIHQFYVERRKTFFVLLGINFFVHSLSVCEVYAALAMLGYPASAATAFIIESLTKIVNLVFGFVPGAVGVYEGGNGVILHSLGFAAATGVALALVRRGAIFFWTAVGLLIVFRRAASGSVGRFYGKSNNAAINK